MAIIEWLERKIGKMAGKTLQEKWDNVMN